MPNSLIFAYALATNPIILDGGNVIKGMGKVIITHRVLEHNRYQVPKWWIYYWTLGVWLAKQGDYKPEYPNEETGHADGLIRFIDVNTVFINEPDPDNQEWEKRLRATLKQNALIFIELPCPMASAMETAEGLYLNYLHVGNLLLYLNLVIMKTSKFWLLSPMLFLTTKLFPINLIG